MKDPTERFIAIEPNPHRVRVLLGGVILAETHRALTLREGPHPPVHYIPRAHVDLDLLEPSSLVTHCPHKGDAAHFTVTAHGLLSKNAAWTYETPMPEVADLKGYIAFDSRRVDAIEELG